MLQTIDRTYRGLYGERDIDVDNYNCCLMEPIDREWIEITKHTCVYVSLLNNILS